jgi:two-component system, OmpR family, alkaline phosphatase synthesis response regulator PhoP
MRDQFPVPCRLHRRLVLFEPAPHEPTDFLNPTGGKLFVDALLDAPVQIFALAIQPEDKIVRRFLVLKIADRLTGRVKHFERADETAGIFRIDVFRSFRIHALQFGKQLDRRQRFEAFSELLIASGTFEQALPERADVQAGAADDERVGQQWTGQFEIPPHIERLGHVADIDEVLAFDFCGADIHPPVHLHRVGRNNLTAQPARQFQANGTLAGGGRTDEENRCHTGHDSEKVVDARDDLHMMRRMGEERKPKILCVDDEPLIRELLYRVLTDEGYDVLTAGDGEEALTVAASGKPELILLDIMMPKLDGMQTCRRLRADPATHDIRVIILTAYDTRDRLEEAITAGADDFLGKPIDMTELRIRVRSLLRVKGMADEVDRLEAYITSMREMRSDSAG